MLKLALNFFSFLIAGFFILLFRITSFRLLYLVSDFFAFFLHRVAGYRRKVVQQNLRACFPELSETRRKQIEHDVYRNLVDILVEGIKGFTMTREQFLKRHRVVNPEVIGPFLESGKSVIGVTAHYNNWEWGTCSASLQVPCNVVGFYKPLSNKLLDGVLRRSRARCGTTLASIRETSLTFARFNDRPTIFLMAADQNPGKPDQSVWVNFLGKETAFLHGPEKHSRANGFSVVYIHIVRKRRGWYELELEPLVDDPAALPYGEITCRYAARVEAAIRSNPSGWLWSHKRWKHQRDPQTQTLYTKGS